MMKLIIIKYLIKKFVGYKIKFRPPYLLTHSSFRMKTLIYIFGFHLDLISLEGLTRIFFLAALSFQMNTGGGMNFSRKKIMEINQLHVAGFISFTLLHKYTFFFLINFSLWTLRAVHFHHALS